MTIDGTQEIGIRTHSLDSAIHWAVEQYGADAAAEAWAEGNAEGIARSRIYPRHHARRIIEARIIRARRRAWRNYWQGIAPTLPEYAPDYATIYDAACRRADARGSIQAIYEQPSSVGPRRYRTCDVSEPPMEPPYYLLETVMPAQYRDDHDGSELSPAIGPPTSTRSTRTT